jgi:hypothetical protein
VLSFALAHAIQGAASQAWGEARSAARTAGSRARVATATKAAKLRKDGSRPARLMLGTGVALGGAARGLWWVTYGTGRALWVGGRDGWCRGWEKGRARAEARNAGTRAVKQGGRDDPSPPGWRNYLTGRCPWCHHAPKDDSDGCGCENLDWACPCARRNHQAPPPVVPNPPDHAPPVSTPSGGDGPAASADPDQPEPLDSRPPDPEPTPAPQPEEDPMPLSTSEPVGYAGTCRALEEIGAATTTYLDTASAARTEAEELRRMAEQMRANMSVRDMDPASLAAVASLTEQAARLERAADDLASAADGTRAASATALDAVQTHAGVAEAVQSHEHAADKEYYLEGR